MNRRFAGAGMGAGPYDPTRKTLHSEPRKDRGRAPDPRSFPA